MKKIVIGILCGMAAIAATTFSANAQASRTWVSGVGDDVNPCTRTAPCKTFAGAISKTAAGGEINCLDPGGFGAVTITKSMDIICQGVTGGVTHAGTSAFIINAGANDVVVLKGLDIEGGGSASLGLNGIRFLAGAALHVEDVIIRDSRAASPNGNGILFAPSAGTPELTVRNVTIINNGSAASGAGIQIRPTGSGGVKALIEDTVVGNNNEGILVDGRATTGVNTATIRNSSTSNNAGAGVFVADSGGGTTDVTVEGSTAANNGSFGIGASGANATVRVKNSTVTGNANGLVAAASSQIISQGGNTVAGNTTNGAFTSSLPLQ